MSAAADFWRSAARRWLAAGGLALVAATWPLWQPPGEPFPQAPGIVLLASASSLLDRAAIAAVLGGWLIVAAAPGRARRLWQGGLAAALAGQALAVALNQHRFQPWVYQQALFAVALLGLQGPAAAWWQQRLVAAIYLYSAVSKFDYAFLHTLGPTFVETFLGPLGPAAAAWSPEARAAAAAVFPLGELLVGLLFLRSPLGRTALCLSLAMHLGLLWILSPWGLHHQPGVLLWNLFFIGHNGWTYLIGQAERRAALPEHASAEISGKPARLARGLLVSACLWPLLEPWGLCDTWPAWGLYAVRNERLDLYLREDACRRLPPTLQNHLEPDPGDGWRRLRIDLWSLAACRAPIYPAARFQAAVAEAVRRDQGLAAEELRLVCRGAARRWDGARDVREFSGEQAAEFLDSFWLPARPRARM